VLIIVLFTHLDTFDGAMIVLATYSLNIFHPGRLLSGYDELERVEVGVADKDKISHSPSAQSV
jgi:hypothetical protein